MIKLELPQKPTELTAKLQAQKTTEFINSGKKKKVWGMEWLKKAVLEMSFGKCCYTEIRLNEESKYMEIEHFYPKSKYPKKVLEWGNLLPSCKKCNIEKDEHDVKAEPIVNPFIDNPKEFFYFKNYKYHPKNEKGEKTISVLGINHFNHFVTPRSEVGVRIVEILEYLKGDIDKLGTDKEYRYIRQIKQLLERGNRKKEYSALTASTILNDDNFSFIENTLKARNFWDNELEELKNELIFCAL